MAKLKYIHGLRVFIFCMCEIQFVKWAIEIDERSDLPCINLYYTMDYDNKLWCHRFYFDELLIKDEEPNFRSIIYNLILEKENQYISCDDEWMKPDFSRKRFPKLHRYKY